MQRIFLLGYTPPIFQKGYKVEAAHYRTWQFLEPLIEDGLDVCLCIGLDGGVEKRLQIPGEWNNQLEYHKIPFGHRGWMKQLQKVYDQYNPDCIVATNFYPSLYATRIKTEKPLWLDIYGDMLTIIQASCYHSGSNRGLPTTIQFTKEILNKGDVFSVCGHQQGHMLVGELAMSGRLNYQTFGYSFVEVIGPGAAPLEINLDDRISRPLLSNEGILPQDFVVLWCGGYNTWTDVDTLFAGIEWAMERNPRVHFVSAGESTYNAPDNVYARFLSMIEGSNNQNRYHMMGWRPWEEIPQYYVESDLGINIDALHYETKYGTRTRLLEMMAAGLPVLTSLGSELSYQLEKDGLALVFEIGDWQALGKNILQLSVSEALRGNLIDETLSYAQKELSFRATTAPLQEWLKNPRLAPDRTLKRQNQWQEVKHKGRAVIRQMMWKMTGVDK
jgi:glycosyltransferase involved in cell wall biosynthesis